MTCEFKLRVKYSRTHGKWALGYGQLETFLFNSWSSAMSDALRLALIKPSWMFGYGD
jgi:hypothetical protein